MRMEDSLTRDGADQLAYRIRSYWASKGRNIRVEVCPEPNPTRNREIMFVVRSNLSLTASEARSQ